jgi:hypothetical protein
MPHYYFDIKDGHRLADPSGLNFKNDDDAIAKANVIAIGVSLDEPAVDPERHIAVLNDAREGERSHVQIDAPSGNTMLSIVISDLAAPSPRKGAGVLCLPASTNGPRWS